MMLPIRVNVESMSTDLQATVDVDIVKESVGIVTPFLNEIIDPNVVAFTPKNYALVNVAVSYVVLVDENNTPPSAPVEIV